MRIHNPQSAPGNSLSRRALLRGATSGVGIASTSGWLSVLAQHAYGADIEGKRPKSCILLWMGGGPSHKDTFDLKPESTDAGAFKPIATSVSGIQISEHLPRTARCMQHAAVIRSMSTAEADHDRGSVLMHTGFPQSNGGVKHPCLGAIVSKELGASGFLLPNFVVCNLGHHRLDPSYAGFLGAEHQGLVVPDVNRGLDDLKSTVGEAEFNNRVGLLTELEGAFRGRFRSRALTAHQSNYARSLDLMRSDKSKAFDLSLEPNTSRKRFGTDSFSQSCLMARRLVEVGVPFVEVVLANWDTHSDKHHSEVARLSGIVDVGMSALLEDLHERGLLESTLVIWMGEFGRTPRFGGAGGRDHYARAWSSFVAGGGIRGGQVIGRTDKEGATVEDRPVSAADFMATVCEIMQIDWQKTYEAPGGQVVRLTNQGATPIKELTAS